MSKIDLNCDCGESFGPWNMGSDREVLPHVTSANVACGAHAGDPNVMRQTIQLCREIGLAVGAHPGFPDLQGFGRRTLAMSLSEIENMVLAQLGALAAIAKAEGVELHHVKAHGALYNYAAANPPAAKAIAHAVATFNPQLILVGLAGSALIAAGQEAGLQVAREAFADRAYEPDGSLRNRNLPGAVILNPEQNLAQAISIVRDQKAFSVSGAEVHIQADTICIHGDHSGAAERAAYLRKGLVTAGVQVAGISHRGA